ncbi:hypothetical protein Vretimale_12514 [Volvox reticuliferus]|uniref:Uncharacterized protein n=1 Tax=Volvox reticuliferus TaxID=1737510 RepID=A0A8J4FKA4_9CHLO|nr:hypothetical protein Vretifemale_9128 [Volvox reticuliferus]GIM08501.1 hypothetical protein Vretimale_12514 [Volvox reticuliferus]
MDPYGDSLILAHPSAIDCFEQSACGSASTALGYMVSVGSFESTQYYDAVNGDQSHSLSATGMSWGHAIAAQSGLIESAGNEIVCQAAIFFANRSGVGGVAVGCPCKSCVKTIGFLPTNEPQARPWRYQHPEPCSSKYGACFPSRKSSALGNQFFASSPESPGSEVTPADQTLRMLLDRARQGFDVTAAASATRSGGASGTAPAPVQTLRHNTPSRSMRPIYQHFQAPPVHRRRMEARSSSPIPVPLPPHARTSMGLRRHGWHAVAAHSAGGALYDHIAGAPHDEDGSVAQAEDMQQDKMVRTVMQFYDAMRKKRAKRPPGRPSEPQRVVIGFEQLASESRERNGPSYRDVAL